ncbi:DUF6525 family protein [Paracoccus shanxieyensis]|nr:DUF6525 family protein [Paracoccus shanxieyensis]
MSAPGNLRSSLRRRGSTSPMAAYDRLPLDLRRWLAGAALPWSAHSALRLWRRAMRDRPADTAHALQMLSAAETRLLGRDAGRIWGRDYPSPKP